MCVCVGVCVGFSLDLAASMSYCLFQVIWQFIQLAYIVFAQETKWLLEGGCYNR